MVVFTQDAVNAVVAKVEEQAKLERLALLPVELQMLRWSEVEPDGVHEQALNDQFEAECDTDEYEKKIAGLLDRAFEREKSDPRLRQRWDDIRQTLDGHDYYLLVMLQQASPTRLLSRRSSLRDNLIYLAIGLGIATIAGYFVVSQK